MAVRKPRVQDLQTVPKTERSPKRRAVSQSGCKVLSDYDIGPKQCRDPSVMVSAMIFDTIGGHECGEERTAVVVAADMDCQSFRNIQDLKAGRSNAAKVVNLFAVQEEAFNPITDRFTGCGGNQQYGAGRPFDLAPRPCIEQRYRQFRQAPVALPACRPATPRTTRSLQTVRGVWISRRRRPLPGPRCCYADRKIAQARVKAADAAAAGGCPG